MWRSLPIQTWEQGDEGSMIRPMKYPRHKDVHVSQWKDVPPTIREWCLTRWAETFGTVRTPLSDDDFLGWIPQKGAVAAKYGKWIGHSRSRKVLYINLLFVETSHRNEGNAPKLILSIAHECCNVWGDVPFLFEVDSIPRSLIERGAQSLCRYHYVWIPFVVHHPSKWTIGSLPDTRGFRGSCAGWNVFVRNNHSIVFDSNDDIVWYSDLTSLLTFDRLPGAYCRVFSPTGTSAVFAENMYFPSSAAHYLL